MLLVPMMQPVLGADTALTQPLFDAAAVTSTAGAVAAVGARLSYCHDAVSTSMQLLPLLRSSICCPSCLGTATARWGNCVDAAAATDAAGAIRGTGTWPDYRPDAATASALQVPIMLPVPLMQQVLALLLH